MEEPTLAAVFSKPPPYTREELALVIAKFRESRAQYLVAGKAPKESKPKGAKSKVDISVLDIEL